MESIAKKLSSTLVALLFVFLLFFGMVWHFDSFAAAWQFFFMSDAIPAFLELIGWTDWLIGALISLVVAAIIEALLGRRLKSKGAHLVVELSAFLVTLVGYLQIVT